LIKLTFKKLKVNNIMKKNVYIWLLIGVVCLLIVNGQTLAAPSQQERQQWFEDAGLGLFFHWGIHSVIGGQPSWDMVKDYPHARSKVVNDPESYYALEKDFQPNNYDPDKWFSAAKKAGFGYVLFTTKHHDGYCLWPSKYGTRGTAHSMNGRDLIKKYVDACRNNNMKVGFYFSFADWSHPNSLPTYLDFDYNKGYTNKFYRKNPFDPIKGPRRWSENRVRFEEFCAFTMGQIGELLSWYGTIDYWMWDLFDWPQRGVDCRAKRKTFRQYMTAMQPSMLTTKFYEAHMPKSRPKEIWHAGLLWKGHWGWDITSANKQKPTSWVLENLAQCRAWGGNMLVCTGPKPDGTMEPAFYKLCDELAEWMEHSRESVIGTRPLPFGKEKCCDVPITRKNNNWYLHLSAKHDGKVSVTLEQNPVRASLLRTGDKLKWTRDGNKLIITVPQKLRTKLDDVVQLHWKKDPLPSE